MREVSQAAYCMARNVFATYADIEDLHDGGNLGKWAQER